MLTLRLENHCAPLESGAAQAGGLLRLGGPGALAVVYVRGGPCALRAGPHALEAGDGALAACPAQTQAAPGAGRAFAVALGGAAAAEAAAGLDEPWVGSAAQCPGAAELVVRLAEGAGRLTAAEAAALAYTLLCRLAAGGPEEGLSALVAAAVAEIRAHHASVYGVEELAAGLEVSKHHLIRRFTAEVGVPPGQYLTGVRVEAAKRLMLHGDYPLDIIAGQCGFSGANYLCKVFKKITGETPAAWRKRALEGARREPAPAGPAAALEEQMYL